MSLYTSDERYMRRAMDLALSGAGKVSPNPMVGAVIVHEGTIIGEGWHRHYGEAHAEVNAINSVRDKDKKLLPQSTIYVNLEPCSHHGKTPPCADLLIEKGIKKVTVANLDPNPQVAGRGIERLRQHGVEVTTGVLEDEGNLLNRYFFTYHKKKRPYVLLKWAQTADGFVARADGDSKWISDSYSRQLVHRLRAEMDAIMVGAGTVRQDNPRLSTRDWSGKNPLRAVLSSQPMQDDSLYVLSDGEPTVNYHTHGDAPATGNVEYVRLNKGEPIRALLHDLYKRGVNSLLVEGGANVLQQFIDAELYDSLLTFTSDSRFGEGIASPRLKSAGFDTFIGLNDRIFSR